VNRAYRRVHAGGITTTRKDRDLLHEFETVTVRSHYAKNTPDKRRDLPPQPASAFSDGRLIRRPRYQTGGAPQTAIVYSLRLATFDPIRTHDPTEMIAQLTGMVEALERGDVSSTSRASVTSCTPRLEPSRPCLARRNP